MNNLKRLFYSTAVTSLLIVSTNVYAGFCDGSNFCRTDYYGNVIGCHYAPNYCGYSDGYGYGVPLFWGGNWGGGGHRGGGHWGGGEHGGGGHHH